MLTKALKEGVSKTVFANMIICHRLSHEVAHAAVPQILALGPYQDTPDAWKWLEFLSSNSAFPHTVFAKLEPDTRSRNIMKDYGLRGSQETLDFLSRYLIVLSKLNDEIDLS